MTADNLPRPEALTPFRVGPCASGDPATNAWYIEDAEGSPIGQADAGVVSSMAALPAWIVLADERGRRIDAVRDYAERCLDHDSNMHPEDVIAMLDGEGDQ